MSTGGTVEHAKAGGRVAFSCPSENLRGIEAKVRAAGHTILTPYLSLDTPGKATVQVVILADPVSVGTARTITKLQRYRS